ncbi:glycosyltransferase [Salinicola halophyticus]|uniref:glycosyltransferase n=1 Tax=Salinicola halophyticus TaxID=1808881 RepID=UPI003F45C070
MKIFREASCLNAFDDKSQNGSLSMNKLEGLSVQASNDGETNDKKSSCLDPAHDLNRQKDKPQKTSSAENVKGTVKALYKHLFLNRCKSTKMRVQPYNQLMQAKGAKKNRWQSLGDDPYFILFPTRPTVLDQGGWFCLEYDFKCQETVVQQIYIDYGAGYLPDVAITYTLGKNERVAIPIFLPDSTRGLRLDPMTSAVGFQIDDINLKKIEEPISSDEINAYLQTIDHTSFFLSAMGQVTRCLEDGYHWKSLGIDPCFFANLKEPGAIAAGWYIVEFCIESEWGQGDAKLYFDTGDGYNEKDSVIVPFENHSTAVRAVWIDGEVTDFRFDPQEVKGRFSIHGLEMQALVEEQAIDVMLARVMECHADFAGLTQSQAKAVIGNKAVTAPDRAWIECLLAVYDETFVLKSDIANQRLEYQDWIERIENKKWPALDKVQSFIRPSNRLPNISIIVPVYNTSRKLLEACIESVLAQSYPYWDLCIADDASTLGYIKELLLNYEMRDERVKVVFREENGHISKASNSALSVAQGEYIALLDHDDVLSPHALYFMATAICENPNAAVLYSDEDKIDGEGNRFEPHFKCDWNLDLFLSQNYISHLGVYKKSLIDDIGGFREGVEGAQDQDLLLRCLRLVSQDHIVHIPHILYHWRALEGSTALATEAKDYTATAGIKALQSYIEDQAPLQGTVSLGLAPNTYRIQWALPSDEPFVSLLMPTRDQRAVTELAIRSILEKTVYQNYEIIVLDNGSVEPETLGFFESIQREDQRVKVVQYDQPFNYSAINNFGAKQATGEFLGLINNDVEVISPEWLTEMVSQAARPEVGCVGAKLYYSNDTIQHAGVIVGLGGVAGHSHKHFPRDAAGYFNRLKLVQTLSAVTAACLVLRREVYEEVGGLNEENLKVAFNDVDFCLRVRDAGYRNIWTPYAELYHHESVSRGHEDTPDKIARFAKEIEYMKERWGESLNSDPSYSLHLTRVREDFSIGGLNA